MAIGDNINPRWIVLGGMIFAGAYIFMNSDLLSEAWNVAIPLFALGISGYWFYTKFEDKAKIQLPQTNLGPQQPFNPASSSVWDQPELNQPPVQTNIPPSRPLGKSRLRQQSEQRRYQQ